MDATGQEKADWSDAPDRDNLLSISQSTLSLYAQISLREDIDLSAATFQSGMGIDTLNFWICESLKEIFNLRLLNVFE